MVCTIAERSACACGVWLQFYHGPGVSGLGYFLPNHLRSGVITLLLCRALLCHVEEVVGRLCQSLARSGMGDCRNRNSNVQNRWDFRIHHICGTTKKTPNPNTKKPLTKKQAETLNLTPQLPEP